MSGTLEIGDVLAGRYRLTAVLGMGGMGAVYEATQIDLNRPVAVKLMLPGSAGKDAIARFQREARVTAALHHPGAVKIFDFGRDDDGRFFIVMEKLRGTTLRSFVSPDAPPMPLARTVSIGSQIANVLIAAHAIGLVHRDLKPENVFIEKNLDGSDRVVVVDFGLAYIEDRADVARMTKEGVITGTPVYMSPEQCQGKGVGTAADIYALGCVLYEMACGVPPFDGGSIQLIVKHSFEDAVPPGQRDPKIYVPRSLDELIMEMLRKAPGERPKADAVVTRLAKLETTLGERERARGRELLEGRAARMIQTVRPLPGEEKEDAEDLAFRPTVTPVPPALEGKPLGIVGALDAEVRLALRANGFAPVDLHGPPVPDEIVAFFAPSASEAVLRDLAQYGRPVLTDGDPEDLEHVTRMLALGVAEVVPRPTRAETLSTKLQRALKKHARRAR